MTDHYYEPLGPQLRLSDRNLGEVLLLYEYGTPPEPWLFVRGAEGQWVTFRRATPEDIALLHGLDDMPF